MRRGPWIHEFRIVDRGGEVLEDDGGFGASWSAVAIVDGFNSRRRHSNKNSHESGTQDTWPSMQTNSRLAHAPMDIDIERGLAKGIKGETWNHSCAASLPILLQVVVG